MRDCESQALGYKNGQDELLADRRSLLSKIDKLESLHKEAANQAVDLQNQLQDKETVLEEIRCRITTIAELFEKKEIKQRYSFEVLCDFIHDKAKRLFTKFEKAVQDKKHLLQEDKQGRKIFKLENEMK